MTIERLFHQTIIIAHRSPVGKDAYGNVTYGTSSSITVLGFAEYLDSRLDSTDRNTADTPVDVYLPAGTVVAKSDVITLDGPLAGNWVVDGDPIPTYRPTTGIVHHLALRARRVL